ncbi:MAG: DinB family protein [Cyclobacteriaceae bacterium]
MNQKEHFQQAFLYNRTANEAVIAPYLHLDAIPDKANAVISHLLQAQNIWVSRIDPEKKAIADPWAPISVADWLSVNDSSHDDILGIVSHYTDAYDSDVVYANSMGKGFHNSVSEILHHLLYHGSYHRGQLSLLLRQYGQQPPVTDYIFYLRE